MDNAAVKAFLYNMLDVTCSGSGVMINYYAGPLFVYGRISGSGDSAGSVSSTFSFLITL